MSSLLGHLQQEAEQDGAVADIVQGGVGILQQVTGPALAAVAPANQVEHRRLGVAVLVREQEAAERQGADPGKLRLTCHAPVKVDVVADQ
ncbi:hypothetical protein D9M71_837370 [compost metagenome]